MRYIDLEELKLQSKRIDPRQVLEQLQPDKPIFVRGRELRTCCPVHEGASGAENFAIDTSTHAWFCHSKGCKGTNLIDLVAQSRGVEFIEAAKDFESKFSVKADYKEISTEKKKYTHEDVFRCWYDSKPQGIDTYFSKKKLVPPPIAKFGKNPSGYDSTIIPMLDINEHLKAIHCLSSAGKFNYGETKGAFAILGELDPFGNFYIGEGIATVQTAWEATQRKIPAVSCGTWSNIELVLSAIKVKYPGSKPIVLIDLDKGGNGLRAAEAAKKKFPDAILKRPYFESLPNPNNLELADFNDIISICNQPLDEVRRQLLIEFEMTTVKDNPKIDISQALTSSSNVGQKSHVGCKTAAETLKSLGFIERIKARKFEFEKSGIVKISGIPTNFIQLDNIIDGLQGGHLIVLAGRTGMGKTFVALNMLKNIAIDQKIPAALYSLEMSNTQVFYRLVSLCSGIPATKIKRGTINDMELAEVEAAVKLIENSPLFMTDEPANSILGTLEVNIHSSCKAGEARAIVIDHIGLINCGSSYKDNRANEMGKITMTAKIAAKQHDIPIICLAQLNREADKKEPPKLSQLRESGNLEQDADIVIFVHRRDYYDKTDKPGQVEIIVEKNRDGEPGKVTCEYEKATWLLKESPPITDLLGKINSSECKQFDENGNKIICKL